MDIGPVRIKNRFYQSPHAMPFNMGGKATDDYVEYARERAKGGCGLLIVSMTIPERAKSVQPSPSSRRNIESLRVVSEAVHAAGSKIFVEPFYQWLAAGNWQPNSTPAPALGPSVAQANYYEKRSSTRAMTKAEIRGILVSLREATRNLREAGFDGIMLHASHGALLEQFLSPYFNRRTDEYGGMLENRMRLMLEALDVVRDSAQGEMAVGMRFNCDEMLPGGYGTSEAREVVGRLSALGLLDFIDLDVGVEPEQFYIGMPSVFVDPFPYRPFVRDLRQAAGKVPVLSVLGRLTNVADAEEAIRSGLCDMVGAARALMAEPQLVNNALEGKEDRSRTCIACNACMAAGQDGAQVCAINPASYRERLWGVNSFNKSPEAKKVVVVGGGPAGMEAARVCALQGHDVSLFDCGDGLGGSLLLWSLLPGREFYRRAVDWWERELLRMNVRLRLGERASVDEILRDRPDAVIIATGATYCGEGRSNHMDVPIPGSSRRLVRSPESVLKLESMPTGKVLVLNGDGMHTAVGIAEMLANAGCDVVVLTPGFSPVSQRVIAAQETRFIMKRLRASGVDLMNTTWVREILDDSVRAYDVYSEQDFVIGDLDAVVLCTGRIPVNDLEQALEGKVDQLFVVGDALAPRMWSAAAYEGHKFARMIGDPDAPRTFAEAYFRSDPDEVVPIPADAVRCSQA